MTTSLMGYSVTEWKCLSGGEEPVSAACLARHATAQGAMLGD